MRRGPFLLMLTLLLGAGPALAQDSPRILPTVKQSDAAPAKKQVKRKAVAAKAKPAQTKSAQTKPAETKTAETKTAKTKTTKTNAGKTKPAETEAAETKTAKSKPTEAKPVRLTSAARKRAAAQAAAAKAAAAKKVAAKPAAPKLADAKVEPAPAVSPVIPQGERQSIQAALLWAGDYSGVTGDDPMLAAIRNFQKRHKAKVTGVLTPSERADLLAAAKVHEEEFGWNVVVDPATGIRIGLPGKLVPQARDAAHGTRWSSAHGEVQVETFRIKEPGLTLAALFEREKKTPSTRRIENSALHDDGFVISGQQGLKRFSVRAKLREGEARGFTLLYDQMMETIVEPVMGAMATAFAPFPERSAPYAALAKPVEYGNGLVVSAQGHIITDLKLTQGCQVIVAAGLGDADRLAEDRANGLALLRVYGPRTMSPLMLARDTPKSGTKPVELTLVGIPDPKEQDGGRKLTEIKARLADGGAIELRQPVPMAGFSGAAALGAQGQFLGMMEMGQAVLASVEAAAPPVRLVSADTIRRFLAAQQVETAQAPSGDAAASVVRIICVRK
ncbi:MAG TPA: peptidoglycan-binding protein [Pseudolabrys sp.]|jgi:chemotaxis protein histidine kinase CheA